MGNRVPDDYSFRIRFDLPDDVRINIDESSWTLPQSGDEIPPCLRSAQGATIKEAGSLVLRASGFISEEAALRAAEQYRDVLTVAFARAQVPVNFGDRAPKGMFTSAGIEMLEAQQGQRVLNDVHGAQTFLSEPPPRFVKVSADAQIGRAGTAVKAAVASALEASPQLEAKYHIAYDLYAASAGQRFADARFLLLMMALETLIEPRSRSESARRLVAMLIETVENSGLPEDECKSIVGSLSWLTNESIGQAGRHLARTLEGLEYAGMPPTKFFTECYDIRSSLAHGHVPRVEHGTVGSLAAQLEIFVGDLISTPFLGAPHR